MKELHNALVSIAGPDKKEYQIQDLCKAFEITGKTKILIEKMFKECATFCGIEIELFNSLMI